MTLVKRITIVAGLIALIALSSYIVLKTETDNKNPPKSELEDKSINNVILDTGVTGNTAVTYIDTPYIKEYSLPKGTWSNGILVDRNGIVWIAGSRSHNLLSFDPNEGQIKSSHSIKDSTQNDNVSGSLMVWTMVEDNDGFIWFSQMGPNPLWRFDPTTDEFYSLHSVSGSPFQMKADKETGNIWFTTLAKNTLGVIQKTLNKNGSEPTYKITEFELGNDTYPSGLFLEKNHVWITEILNHKLVKFSVITDTDGLVNVKKILEIPTNDEIQLYSPTDLMVLNDNSVWFTEHGTSTITNYHMDSQSLKRLPTSASPYDTPTLPFWIKENNANMGFWFNEHTGNRIAFLNTTEMALTEYEIPTRPSDVYIVYPLGIALDPVSTNKIWFSEWNTDKIGAVDLSVPIPFDIHSDNDKVILSNDNDIAKIDVQIVKNEYDFLFDNTYNIVNLNASSSMKPNGGFANVTSSFSRDIIDLGEIKEMVQVSLSINNDSAPPGNYTLVISASNGMVTKSIFLDLEIN